MPHSLKWLGHSACQITTSEGKVILIDPWITGNPSCPVTIDQIGRVDLILVTHDHFDHIGTDIPNLVEATGATVIVQPEISRLLQGAGVKASKIIYGMGMNIGGQVTVDDIKITMTQAMHSSGVGSPAGFIITLEDGKTIYHSGDTGIFADMQLFGDIYNIDLALLPIGSVFVMDPVQAAHSLQLLKPQTVIPIHYGTFPILVQDPSEFVRLAEEKAPNVQVRALKPGEEITF
jgi:L-ascorbate metabolism protein UlaG (beta-lactamase superfamily)